MPDSRSRFSVLLFALLLIGCADVKPSSLANVNTVKDSTIFSRNAHALLAIDLATLIVTDKTMIDHMMSYFREEDCSSVRASQGEPYCRPWRVAFTPAPEPFCYRSLARVTCYATPNPYGSDHRMGTYLPGISRIR